MEQAPRETEKDGGGELAARDNRRLIPNLLPTLLRKQLMGQKARTEGGPVAGGKTDRMRTASFPTLNGGSDITKERGCMNMPGRDGTGPAGIGPMTGGGFGNCGTGKRAGAMSGAGRGGFPRGGARGRCFGGGRGMGRRGKPADEEKASLENRADALERELSDIRERIAEIR